MEPLLPFMLLILDLPASGQGQPELERHPALYASEEQCLRASRELVEQRTAGEGASNHAFHAYCMRVPDSGEFERLMEQMEMEGENGGPGRTGP